MCGVEQGFLQRLTERYAHLPPEEFVEALIERVFKGRIAVVSSFGAESSVLLHLVASIDPSVPVLTLDTGKLFAQTEQYRSALADRLGLKDLRIVRPDMKVVMGEDLDEKLYSSDPDRCCEIRKTLPLRQAISGFDAWFTGRKRFQSDVRSSLSKVEMKNGQVKINPLADWSPEQLEAYMTKHNLPRHPMVEMGYRSIGCYTCTRPVGEGEDQRAGRWSGSDKTECGIHF